MALYRHAYLFWHIIRGIAVFGILCQEIVSEFLETLELELDDLKLNVLAVLVKSNVVNIEEYCDTDFICILPLGFIFCSTRLFRKSETQYSPLFLRFCSLPNTVSL